MGKYFTCPGCDRSVSNKMLEENNNCCPYCGLSYDDKEKVEDMKKGYVCPKCADIYTNVRYRNSNGTCIYCGSKLVQTDVTTRELYNMTSDEETFDEVKDKARIVANKYGDFQFSETAYNEKRRIQREENEAIKRRSRRSQASNSSATSSSFSSATQQSTTNIPQCPTCGSTNIKKISATSKAVGAGLFGLFSKTARSQFECKDCGYKW